MLSGPQFGVSLVVYYVPSLGCACESPSCERECGGYINKTLDSAYCAVRRIRCAHAGVPTHYLP